MIRTVKLCVETHKGELSSWMALERRQSTFIAIVLLETLFELKRKTMSTLFSYDTSYSSNFCKIYNINWILEDYTVSVNFPFKSINHYIILERAINKWVLLNWYPWFILMISLVMFTLLCKRIKLSTGFLF